MRKRKRLNEEEIKVKVVIPLLAELGFDSSALHLETFLRDPSGRRQYADIVVTTQGTPIILVETKAEGINPRAPGVIEQAVNYCRSFERVIPYALLTNGKEIVLVNTLDKSVVLAGERQSVLHSARALERDVLVSLTEAMQRTSLSKVRRLSHQALLECASTQSRRELALLAADATESGRISDAKYIERLFVERAAIGTQFRAFRYTTSGVFALVGNAGMGKTNLLCWLAGQLRGAEPVLFYNGMSLDRGLTASLATDLRTLVEARTLSSLLDRIRAECSKPVFLFIDALNECVEGRATLRSELNELVTSDTLRVVISCRTLDWDYWCRNDRGMLNHFGRAVFVPLAAGGDLPETRGVVLGELTPHEFSLAWAKYQRAFSLSGALSARMVTMCKEPFMLRLVAAVYRDGKEIPDYIEPVDLFRRYFDEKLPSRKDRLAAQRVLSSLAAQILATRLPRVPISELPSGCTETLHRLLDENIIIFVQDNFIYFHFELFLEYVVAQYLISQQPRGGDIAASIASLTTSDLLNMPGIVENVLLMTDYQAAQVTASLERLARNPDDRWRAIACSIVKRLRVHPPEVASAITMLATDDNYVIRMFLAQSLGPFILQHGTSILSRLARDDRWEARETAALALGYPHSTDDISTRALHDLTDDLHWRVRRAAGYALHRIWTNGAVASQELRQRLLRAPVTRSWRTKYSACIGLLGSQRELDAEESAYLLELARDDNPQVRWAVAHYLPRLAGAAGSPIMPLLLNDKEAWIRRKLAESLLSLHRTGEQSVADVLSRLAQDPDFSVRVTVARRGERIADQWFVQILDGYRQPGQQPDVRVAAAYTLELLGVECFEVVASDAIGSGMRDVYRCRERIGRRDPDPAHARFSPVHEYISRRTEFHDRRDPYMRTIDAMCSLIAASSAALGRRKAELLSVLADDCDEEIRWALVLFLTKFGLNTVPRKLRMLLVRKLAADPHWWVRREVAAALVSFGSYIAP